MNKVYGLDIETYDPDLNDRGASWVYGNGYIICVSLFTPKHEKKVYKGAPAAVKKLLLDHSVTIVGANIGYDIGWLEHHFDIKGQTKAKLYDVIIADTLLDEYGRKNLDFLGEKYLKRGKKKSSLETWALENNLKGDFRKHLKDAPWELIEEYALDDAELPVLILEKQLPLLAKESLMDVFELDCSLIKHVLKMKQRGVRIDVKKRAENRVKLEEVLEEKRSKFKKKYGDVNFNSPKQVAAFLDMNDVDYNMKITVKSFGKKTFGYNTTKDDVYDIKEVYRGFRLKKGVLFGVVKKSQSQKVCDKLLTLGYGFICNPKCDKKFLGSVSDDYASVKLAMEIKQIEGIISKFLGEGFDRYITEDNRVHGDFHITKTEDNGTISGRLSASSPNLQQIPSKGVIMNDAGEEFNLAQLCREIFIPEEDCWLLKIDYSQVEYRCLLHYAVGPGADEVRKKFQDNPKTDYHQIVMDMSGLERKYAKNLNFGIMYGMGIGGMVDAFGWNPEHAEDLLNQYHAAMPFVDTTMQHVMRVGSERGYIRTIKGRRARLRSKDLAYTLLNRLNQGGSADIMKEAMRRIFEEGIDDITPVHITVHDELVCSVPKTKEGLEAVLRIRDIMEHCVELKVPLLADPELGENWYDVEEFDYATFKKKLPRRKTK